MNETDVISGTTRLARDGCAESPPGAEAEQRHDAEHDQVLDERQAPGVGEKRRFPGASMGESFKHASRDGSSNCSLDARMKAL